MSAETKTDWDSVYAAAEKAGARYPELVAAQWALESGYGNKTAGRNNYFGLKGKGTKTVTTEFEGGKAVTLKDEFMNFDSLQSAVDYLVRLWYKDYKQYKGANNASSVSAAARHLQKEGYATDPTYANKLIRILKEKTETVSGEAAGPPASPAPVVPKAPATPPETVLFKITALETTYLKKSEEAASKLPDNQKVEVEPGKTYGVAKVTELPRSSHVKVVLGGNAGVWYIYLPHWKYEQKSKPLLAEVDWNDFDSLITKNLTVGEVLQWDKRRIPPAQSAIPARIIQTAEQFQRIRDAWGKPLGVTSWYRPEPINTQQGGVRGSQHTLGTAFDVYPVGMGLGAFYEWIQVRWSGGLGDGRRKGFVHLDTRGNGVFVPGAGARNYTWWTY